MNEKESFQARKGAPVVRRPLESLSNICIFSGTETLNP